MKENAMLAPETGIAIDALEAVNSPRLEMLFRRMRHNSDFPAISAAIAEINRIADSEHGHVTMLADAILQDVALTNKLLRLVNTVPYAQYSTTRIATISRAIVVLGTETIRSAAISLRLFDQLGSRAQSDGLKVEVLRASFAALIARMLCPQVLPANPEEAYLCALFRDLGRLVTQFYLPDDAAAVRHLVEVAKQDETQASLSLLGMSYASIGVAVGQVWHLPRSMLHSMRPPPAGQPPTMSTLDDGLRALASFSAELGRLVETLTGDLRKVAVDALCRRYRECFVLSPTQVERALVDAARMLGDLARLYGIDPARTPMQRLFRHDAALVDEETAEAVDEPPDAESLLAVGLQDIGQALVADTATAEALQIAAEAMFRALRPRHVVIAVREGQPAAMTARIAIGHGAELKRARFRFAVVRGERDLFNVLLLQESDLLVGDAREARLHARLPGWYREHFDAGSFLVMPLRLRQQPIGLIYIDVENVGGLVITPRVFGLLRALRLQVLLALKREA